MDYNAIYEWTEYIREDDSPTDEKIYRGKIVYQGVGIVLMPATDYIWDHRIQKWVDIVGVKILMKLSYSEDYRWAWAPNSGHISRIMEVEYRKD